MEESIKHARPGRLTVYLVEDSAILSKLLVSTLQSDLGAHVVGYSGDAEAAIAAIGELKPDVVIVDLVLHTGNGFEVLTACRDMDAAPARIVLTNHSTAAYRQAAHKLGVADERYFDKTTQIGAMCALIRQLAAAKLADSNLADAKRNHRDQ